MSGPFDPFSYTKGRVRLRTDVYQVPIFPVPRNCRESVSVPSVTFVGQFIDHDVARTVVDLGLKQHAALWPPRQTVCDLGGKINRISADRLEM